MPLADVLLLLVSWTHVVMHGWMVWPSMRPLTIISQVATVSQLPSYAMQRGNTSATGRFFLRLYKLSTDIVVDMSVRSPTRWRQSRHTLKLVDWRILWWGTHTVCHQLESFTLHWAQNHRSLTRSLVPYSKTRLYEGKTDHCWSATAETSEDHVTFTLYHQLSASILNALVIKKKHIRPESWNAALFTPRNYGACIFWQYFDWFRDCSINRFFVVSESCPRCVHWGMDRISHLPGICEIRKQVSSTLLRRVCATLLARMPYWLCYDEVCQTMHPEHGTKKQCSMEHCKLNMRYLKMGQFCAVVAPNHTLSWQLQYKNGYSCLIRMYRKLDNNYMRP